MKPVRTVERALNVLFVVAESERPPSLTRLSEVVGLDKATTLRLLATLERAELVRRDQRTRCYVPGPGIQRLLGYWHGDLRQASRPALEALARATGETVSLLSSRDLERVVIDVVPAAHELSVIPVVGTSQPIYSGAAGRVFMAFRSEEERERIISLTGLYPLKPAGSDDLDGYRRSLAEVREAGYAYTVGDVTPGAAAVAAPILSSNGELRGVVSLRGPEVRMPKERIPSMAKMVNQTASEIGLRFAGSSKRDDVARPRQESRSSGAKMEA